MTEQKAKGIKDEYVWMEAADIMRKQNLHMIGMCKKILRSSGTLLKWSEGYEVKLMT